MRALCKKLEAKRRQLRLTRSAAFTGQDNTGKIVLSRVVKNVHDWPSERSERRTTSGLERPLLVTLVAQKRYIRF